MDRHTHTKKNPPQMRIQIPILKSSASSQHILIWTPTYPPAPIEGWMEPMREKVEDWCNATQTPTNPRLEAGCSGPSSPPRPRLRPPPKGPSSVPPRPRNGLTQRPPKTAGWEEPKRWDGGAECSSSSSCKKCTHPDITSAIA